MSKQRARLPALALAKRKGGGGHQPSAGAEVRLLVVGATGSLTAACVVEDFADVVERGRGADVAAQDGEVLVAGDVGDLALLDAGGRGGGRVPGAQRVPGEQRGGEAGGLGAALDDQRDGLVCEALGR